jgi:hypothetical protein
VLRDSLARVGTAQDRATFRREVAALVARADDGHANVGYGLGIPPEGECQVPAHVRYIEGRFVVKSLWEGTQSDLRIGDVIVAIDGNRSSMLRGPTTERRTKMRCWAALRACSCAAHAAL